MRVVAQQWMSVDGYASGTAGESELFASVPEEADAASQHWNGELLDRVEVVLLGRRTYESFVQFWPDSHEPIAGRVNAVPKVVCSRTLDAAPWGGFAPARIERDAVAFVRGMRPGSTGTVLIWGSLELMHDLVRANEIDELDLFIAPVALGGGTPLLPVPLALTQLELDAFPGALHVRYALGD